MSTVLAALGAAVVGVCAGAWLASRIADGELRTTRAECAALRAELEQRTNERDGARKAAGEWRDIAERNGAHAYGRSESKRVRGQA